MKKLKSKILEEGMTPEELASNLGISVKTLNAKFNNRSRITIREAEIMSNILNIDKPSDIFFAPESQKCND